jgi:hypothetical protein
MQGKQFNIFNIVKNGHDYYKLEGVSIRPKVNKCVVSIFDSMLCTWKTVAIEIGANTKR